MKMTSMWYAINSSDIEKSMKHVIFVGINILLWAAIAFIVCVAGGVIGGSFNEKWRFMTFLITGYSAVIMGFLSFTGFAGLLLMAFIWLVIISPKSKVRFARISFVAD